MTLIGEIEKAIVECGTLLRQNLKKLSSSIIRHKDERVETLKMLITNEFERVSVQRLQCGRGLGDRNDFKCSREHRIRRIRGS